MTNFPKEPLPVYVRYGAAAFLTMIALALVLIVRPRVELNAFNLFQGAVFLSTWFGGLGPGLAASLLSILAMSYFFIPPLFTFTFSWVDGGIDLAVFGVSTFIISSLSSRAKEANARLEQAHEKLEERIEERTEQLSRANVQLSSEIASRTEAEGAILEISQREQQRMGQDLHDGLCQTLAGLRLVAQTLNDQLTEKSLPEKSYADKIEDLSTQALTQADSISRGLYPVELEAEGLMAALQEMAGNVSMLYSVQCRFVRRWKIFVKNSAVATHLFRIAQETVMNAVKSGKTKTIVVRFFSLKSHIILVVADDGVGFDPATARKGMGLKIIDYRARLINASFRLQARPRKGTLAACSFSAQLVEGASAHAG